MIKKLAAKLSRILAITLAITAGFAVTGYALPFVVYDALVYFSMPNDVAWPFGVVAAAGASYAFFVAILSSYVETQEEETQEEEEIIQ